MTGIIRALLARGIGVGMCWFLLAGEVHAGPYDRVGNWLIGFLITGGAIAFGIHRVRSGTATPSNQTVTYNLLGVPRPRRPNVQPPNVARDLVDTYNIWYATNRKMKSGQFTSELSEQLRFGRCAVAVPKSHKTGSLGSAPYVRAFQRLTTGSDDALRIVWRREWPLKDGPNGFLTSIKAVLDKTPSQILVYIHGYNVQFEESLLRTAQIGFDLRESRQRFAGLPKARRQPTWPMNRRFWTAQTT
jgi:hypothetical protein